MSFIPADIEHLMKDAENSTISSIDLLYLIPKQRRQGLNLSAQTTIGIPPRTGGNSHQR